MKNTNGATNRPNSPMPLKPITLFVAINTVKMIAREITEPVHENRPWNNCPV